MAGSRTKTYEAFGAYVRSQRELAQLSLRQAAELARISNPYLSQIEHGLTLPSVAVLSALAEALQVSADALLMRAAGAANGTTGQPAATSEDAIKHDPRLDEAQKRALLGVLATYVGSGGPPSTRRSTRTKPGTAQARTTKGKP
jgi:transcriptional regulator with XRE-family HTH domain